MGFIKFHKGKKIMVDRFKVLSVREPIGTGRFFKDENGNKVEVHTATRREILLQDTKKVYGGQDGIVAEFFDMEFADKTCAILNQCWVK